MSLPARMLSRHVGPTALGVALCVAGCASGERRGGVGHAADRPEIAAVDPSKAGLTLERATSEVVPPVRPDGLKPLSERAASQVARARELAVEQRFTEATIALERALRYDPDHPAVHAALASLHWGARNIGRARQHAMRALESNPAIAEAHYILGRGALADGRIREGLDELRKSQLCDDTDSDPVLAARTHFHLADALAHEGYLQAAIDQYSAFLDATVERTDGGAAIELTALLSADRLTARKKTASLLERLGRYGDAADAILPAVTVAPDDANLAVRYAELLSKAERFEDALAALRSVSSGDDAVLDLLGEIHRKSGHPERIVDDLRARLARRPHEPRFALRLANELVALERLDEAQSELARFLDTRPDAHAVRLRLVDTLMAARQWVRALETCAGGITHAGAPVDEYESKVEGLADSAPATASLLDGIDPRGRSATEMYLLAVLAKSAGRAEQAESLLAESAKRDPTFTLARVRLGRLYFDSFRYDDVIRIASAGEGVIPHDPQLALLVGRAYERLDDLDNAELHLRAVTQLDRSNAIAMLELANVYERSGRSNMAQRQFQVLLDQNPGHPVARERLAAMYMRENKFDAAFEQIAELRRRSDSEATKARYQSLLDPELRRNPEARRAFLFEAAEKHVADAALWIAIAETYDDFHPQEKRDAYAKAWALDPNNEDALWGLVDAEQRSLEFEQATVHSEELLKRRPNRHLWRLALLDMYSVLGRGEEVLALAREFDAAETSQTPRRRDYRSRIIKALRRHGRGDELMGELERWAAADTEVTIWDLWLADEYIERNQAARSVPIYRRQYDANPNNWGALASLSDALVKAGHAERAAQYVLDRLDTDPDSDQGAWMLASVLADSGRTDAAIELVRNRLLRTRNRENFQDFLVDRYRTAQRWPEAIDLIKSLIDETLALIHTGRQRGGIGPAATEPDRRVLQPNEPFTAEGLHRRYAALRLQLGLALVADKQFRVAEERISEWLDASRDRIERTRLLWLLAACQRERGDEDRANETIRKVLVLQPANVSLNNDVAYTLIDRGVDLEEAERMIRFSVWRSPEQAAYLDTYGWLQYKKGLFSEARKWFDRALATQRQPDPVILDHLGDTLWRLGEGSLAIESWGRAVERARARLTERETPPNADERRVDEETPGKIEAVRAGEEPSVAPLAHPPNEEAPVEPDEPAGTRL